MAYEELEHTADWAIRVRGKDLADLFVQAAEGMMSLAGVALGEPETPPRAIQLEAEDPEMLLVDFLQELLVALELRNVGYSAMDIEVEANTLSGSVHEAPVLELQKPVKAVTYNDLIIETHDDRLEVSLVFDV